jgi:hypothetical protein
MMSQVALWILTGLAAYRLWRLIGADDITARLRDRVVGADNGEDPDRSVLFLFLTCPWCLGSWTAFAVYGAVAQVAHMELPVLQAVAGATLVGLIGTALDEG